MKVKVDENLPLQITVELRSRTHDVHTVGEEGLTGIQMRIFGRRPNARVASYSPRTWIFQIHASFSPVLTMP